MKKIFTLLATLILLNGCCGENKKCTNGQTTKTKLTFAFFTDVHTNKNNGGIGDVGLKKALDNAKSRGVELVIFGGDNADTDALGKNEFTADSLHAQFKKIVDKSGIPAQYTIGNHE